MRIEILDKPVCGISYPKFKYWTILVIRFQMLDRLLVESVVRIETWDKPVSEIGDLNSNIGQAC